MTLSKEEQQRKKALEEANKLPEQAFYTHWKLREFDEMVEAMRKEMSRQVGEMQRWKDYHENGDPEGALKYLEVEITLIKKAIAYRNLYSKRKIEVNRHIPAAIANARKVHDHKEEKRLEATIEPKQNEMYALLFKVFRIYFRLKENLMYISNEEDENAPLEWQYEE